MKKLFLCSSFKDVERLFEDFAKEDFAGKRVTFIPTASIVEKVTFYVKAGKKALEKMGLVVEELEVSTSTPEQIASTIQTNEYLYVTGGNTFFLLQELKRKEADKEIIKHIEAGKIYIGESAGAMIVSPQIDYVTLMDDTSLAPELNDYKSLNCIDFYPVPHYTNFPFEKSVENIIAKYDSQRKLYPITNSQAIGIQAREVDILPK